jgi:hypothetical protein
MAAITPHLEQQDDPSESPAEKAYDALRAQRTKHRLTVLRGLGQSVEPSPSAMDLDAANRAVQVAHSKLVATAWTRRAIEQELQGRTITVEVKGRELFLMLDVPIEGPLWNPAGSGASRKVSVLGWTKKMGCPSFSLPAGPPEFGGSCPGAVGGQSIVPEQNLRKGALQVLQLTGQPVNLADAVCEWCYAEGGNYRYGSKQLAQVVLYMWTRRAVADGTFVPALDWAIKNADFHLEAFSSKKLGSYPAERRGKFFRIHDSGDFFSPEYLRAWKTIAEHNPDVMFWAPSRYWAAGRGAAFVNEINTPPRNLIIRPSAFMVDREAPSPQQLGPGWSGGSTVFDLKAKPPGGPFHEQGPYNWDCQAYAVEEEAHTCRHAVAPDRKKGCRACWLHPDYVVNYTKHP